MKVLILIAVGPPGRFIVSKHSRTTGEQEELELKGKSTSDGACSEQDAKATAAAHKLLDVDRAHDYVVSPKLYLPGQTITLDDDDLAQRYIKSGIAADIANVDSNILKQAEATFKGVMKAAPDEDGK